MVHWCLLVPEILGLVCEVLWEDWTTGLLDEQLATLAALARICRAFEGPALDSLWREISGLHPLLCIMPLDLFKMEENFSGEKKNLLVCTIANYLLSRWNQSHRFRFKSVYAGQSWHLTCRDSHHILTEYTIFDLSQRCLLMSRLFKLYPWRRCT